MMSGLDGPRVEAAAAETAAILRRARSQAIVANAPVAVRIDVDAPSVTLPGERPYALPERLSLSLFTAVSEQHAANVGEIRFFPDGSSTGGEVTVTGQNARQYVQVDWLTGRVAVYDDR